MMKQTHSTRVLILVGVTLTSVEKPIQTAMYCSSCGDKTDTKSPPSFTQSCLASDQRFLVSAFSL